MAEPFANATYYADNFGTPPARADALLARASRYIRSEVPGVDERISAGALDVDLVADIVCEIVETATTASSAGVGVESTQIGVGPFQQTWKYSNPVGDMYLTRKHRRLLGARAQRAGNADLLAHLAPVDAQAGDAP